ncbi:hypothetical protein ID866_5269 [Astraeus odoratus]|nr:hypothetical protein ID866_5269 [Astraeus odoratus]
MHVPVPVLQCATSSHVSEGDAGVQSQYARAPLKACVMAICNSSPELLQDSSRDFSLYVLDPLEAQPAPHASTTGPSARGVAVALGLMTWALESDESASVYVTGTILPSSAALEVVFALREVRSKIQWTIVKDVQMID